MIEIKFEKLKIDKEMEIKMIEENKMIKIFSEINLKNYKFVKQSSNKINNNDI